MITGACGGAGKITGVGVGCGSTAVGTTIGGAVGTAVAVGITVGGTGVGGTGVGGTGVGVGMVILPFTFTVPTAADPTTLISTLVMAITLNGQFALVCRSVKVVQPEFKPCQSWKSAKVKFFGPLNP